jgi:hypothetical protein
MRGVSTFTPELGDAICDLVASGDSQREAARKNGVNEASVRFWRREIPEFGSQYARAVTERAEVFFERGNDIAMAIKTGEEAQVARVQLDWLKWSAARMGPKQYGDKVQQEVSGPDGGPIQAAITVQFVKTGESEPNS